jgi:hypothetical protein
MKARQFSLLFTTFLFIHSLQAQYTIGIRSGYINSWEDYGDVNLPDEAKTHVNGFHIAGLGYYALDDNFSLGLEPGYAQKGAACFPGSFYFLFDTKFQLNYIEMPFLIAAHLPVGQKHFQVHAKAGYGFSYLVSAYRYQKEFGSDEEPSKEKWDFQDSELIKRWDNGFYGGLGIDYSFGKNKLFVESTYYLSGRDVFTVSESKNRSIYIGLGLMTKV